MDNLTYQQPLGQNWKMQAPCSLSEGSLEECSEVHTKHKDFI